MKNILCFGDSNTYGANPFTHGRWGLHERWTGRLQDLLGSEYRVIEEGCSARTSLFTDDLEGADVGRLSLPVALQSHCPLDLVILMLGTNDMKHRFALLPEDIAVASMKLAQMVLQYDFGVYKAPQVLMMSPIEIAPGIEHGINTGFSENAVEVSRCLAPFYKKYADQCGVHFLNAAEFAVPSEVDMLHMDLENHAALAEAVHQKVLSIFQKDL